MTRLRAAHRRTAGQAQPTQALLTTFNEVDLRAVNELRARYKDKFEKEHGVKLGFMSFFVKATIEALKRFPVVNAAVDGNDIVYHEYYDIGVAVSTDRGLVVPVLRDADRSLRRNREGRSAITPPARATASSRSRSSPAARSRSPTAACSARCCRRRSSTRRRARSSACTRSRSVPWPVDGQVVIRPMMYLALTYDHRIIDGREAVQFLVAVKECLEDPGRMLLGV
jgi:2-oxoglutarate dehydrogenase E2 component (dihydrolipoamide succinyltransferase)